jgi:hypothetical protein
MGEVERYPNGTFCWVDLGTNDAAGAKAFYGGLLGWEFDDRPGGGEETYTLCRLRGRDVAGIHPHDPDKGIGWASSVAVDDLEATTTRARDLGAALLAEPFDVAGAGRTAVLRDPAGAVVSLWQADGHAGAELVNEDGTWTWNELVSGDLAAGRDFYVELFGWSASDAPGAFPRTTFTLGELLVGGGHAPAPGEDPTPRWSIAFWVPDADEAAARAKELGGTVLLPPMDIPVGRFTILADPQGASFSASAVPGGPARGVDGS